MLELSTWYSPVFRQLNMLDRHADPLDEASALSASITEQAIAEARRTVAKEFHPDFDGESCIDCGDTIPEARLLMGRIRCVRCQTLKERRAAQYSRI